MLYFFPPTLDVDGRDAQAPVKSTARDLTKTVESQKPALEKAASEATTQADSVTKQASGEAQDLIDRIKTLIAEKKYQGAMAAVNEAARLRLTPDQQKLVDELKQQVEKAMTGQAASEGAKAAGDLLKKK